MISADTSRPAFPVLPDLAYQRVTAFARRFGELHITLAMHAALPVGLTPELLHLIRLNFVDHAPRIAEADLLLSYLCQEVGENLYEMEREVRELLLDELRSDPDFGPTRLRQLGNFLLAYSQHNLKANLTPEMREFLKAQQWVAFSYVKPSEANKALAEALRDGINNGDISETVRIASLTQALSNPQLTEDRILLYSAGIEKLTAGDAENARHLFELAGSTSKSLNIEGVELPAAAELFRKIQIAPVTGLSQWSESDTVSEVDLSKTADNEITISSESIAATSEAITPEQEPVLFPVSTKFDLTIAAKPDGSGWTVELVHKGQRLGGHGLGLLQADTLVLPVPPEANRIALPTGYTEIWTNPNQTVALFRNLFARISQAGLIETVGLYLFSCLFGPKLWAAAQARLSPDDALELRLNITDPDLVRLPWEMACNEQQVLLSDPRVNLYRSISPHQPTPPDPLPPVELPLRVLFVIAAEQSDPEINAASEYLNLLRRLQENEGVPIEIRLQSTLTGPASATFEAMQRTLKLFQPHVLHLVAHGGLDGGQAYLRFPVENKGDDGRRDAANLEAALSRMNLQAVVLNVCDEGQAQILPDLAFDRLLTIRSTIAARLVEAGIPFVVGLNGRIADQVCRLFVREFYTSLTQGESVPEATARGRRAGLNGQYQADRRPDWALPVLFLPRDGRENLVLQEGERFRNLEQRAQQVIPPRRPDFCDRLAFLQTFQNLLIPGRLKQPALALYTSGPEGRRLGKTRLLEEMGRTAIRAGHFACVIPAEEKIDFKGYLTRTVALNIEQTAEYWFSDEPFSFKQLDLTLKALDNPLNNQFDSNLVEAVKNLLRRGTDEALEHRALVAAMCQDLVNLADRLEPGKLVFLLFDDLHAIGTALPYFHDVLLERGLYTISDRVRTVFAFDSAPLDRREFALELFLYIQQSQWINLMQVTPFGPEEEALAYRQFVLHRDPPLVEVGSRNELLLLFQRQVQGKPDNFLTMEKDLIPFLLQIQALAEAKDFDLLPDKDRNLLAE